MRLLVKLRFVQMKAYVRNLFARPVSVVVTLLLVLVYGSMLVPVFLRLGDPPIQGRAADTMILATLGFALLMEAAQMLQNRKSMFWLADAHYLFTGPFSRRRVLAAYAMDNGFSALLLGLFFLLPVVMGTVNGGVPLPFLLAGFLSNSLAHFGLLNLNGIFYVRQMARDRGGNSSLWLIAAIAAVLVATGAAVFLLNGMDVPQTTGALLSGPVLNWIPFFGWARMAMRGVIMGNAVLALAGFGLLAGAGGLVTAVLVRQKGDYVERSMMDAESFTDYYKKARSGEDVGEVKVHKAQLRFARGEAAILSKNLLISLKGRELLRLQDFIVIAVYLIMALFMDMGFEGFSGMLMFWMFMMAGTSSLVEDLRHHYVYLIPGGALKKLLCTLLVPLAKSVIVLLVSLVASGLLMGVPVADIALTAAFLLTMLPAFMAGNVLAVRLLKSRNNRVAEQMLRMLTAALIIVPGAVVYYVVLYALPAAAMWATPAFAALNLLLAVGILAACAPMMQGNELNAD